jgi:L-seryl-tRNA(Ser) seleniumtransferase
MPTVEELTKDPYAALGVRKFINATCHWTKFGGTLIHDDVLDAMREAARWHIDMNELQKAAGRVISQYTHAEDGYIVAGCAAAMLVGTAAILTGKDPAKMMQLPDTTGMRNLCVAKRFERRRTSDGREYIHYGYAHAVKTAGVKFIEIGDGETVTREEFERAMSPEVALVYWVGYAPAGDLPVADMIDIAHRHGVKVLIDASNSLPPRENLHRFTDLGADVVCFSGGKGLQGPQGAGIIAGSREIIEAVTMQSAPTQGIGRVSKVSKEEVVGQIAALTLWAEEDDEARMTEHHRKARLLSDSLRGLRNAEVSIVIPDHYQRPYPTVHVKALAASGMNAKSVLAALHSGDPAIAGMGHSDAAVVRLDVRLCEDEEIKAVGRRVREIFAGRA